MWHLLAALKKEIELFFFFSLLWTNAYVEEQ